MNTLIENIQHRVERKLSTIKTATEELQWLTQLNADRLQVIEDTARTELKGWDFLDIDTAEWYDDDTQDYVSGLEIYASFDESKFDEWLDSEHEVEVQSDCIKVTWYSMQFDMNLKHRIRIDMPQEYFDTLDATGKIHRDTTEYTSTNVICGI